MFGRAFRKSPTVNREKAVYNHAMINAGQNALSP